MEANALVLSVEADEELVIAEVEEGEFMPIGITGEKPCGPQIDLEESLRRIAAGEIVSTPEELTIFIRALFDGKLVSQQSLKKITDSLLH